ncbi:hypothetical protein RJ639_039721 [Escallonia herrerae]|uniref:Uncharacterized protein n=1 Tax=Escallonia herrerae TaxID=1293975 RepID=A0AA88WJW5_9ASTE|nr:hypothetical protein RJ639_039721 [Escallonia herrerae]
MYLLQKRYESLRLAGPAGPAPQHFEDTAEMDVKILGSELMDAAFDAQLSLFSSQGGLKISNMFFDLRHGIPCNATNI